MSHLEFLRSIDAFREVDDMRLQAFASQCREMRFAPDEKILARGEPGDCMYIIRKGSVRVPVYTSDGFEKFVAVLGEGEVFGEMSMVLQEPRIADVYATSAVECLAIDREPLQALIRQCPPVAAMLTAIVGARLLRSGHIEHVGKYRIIGKLGRGGVSNVYEAIDPDREETVAIKMLSHELVYDEDFLERFRTEATMIAGLDHLSIVRIHEFVEAYATYFIVMEKAEGSSLRELPRGRVTESVTRSVIRQLASALDHAHERRIVHRDIKPDNVIMDRTGRVKLTDFGIARGVDESDMAGEVIGTPEYMSPEQAAGRPLDGRSDIYSLGVMVFEMLTGQLPFESTNPWELIRLRRSQPMPKLKAYAPRASRAMCEFVDKATRMDPDERYRDCQEILECFGLTDTNRAGLRRVRIVSIDYPVLEEARVSERIEDFLKSVWEIPGVLAECPDKTMERDMAARARREP